MSADRYKKQMLERVFTICQAFSLKMLPIDCQ